MMNNQDDIPMKPFDWINVENESTEETAIKIVTGEFSDVIVSIGKISFDEDSNVGLCRLSFDYDIKSGFVSDDRLELFEKSLGDMLLFVLIDSIKTGRLSQLISESKENVNA